MTWNSNFGPFRKLYVAAFLTATAIIGIWTVFTSCTKEDIVNETPVPPNPQNPPDPPKKDTTAPTIATLLSTVDIIGIEEILIKGNELYVGDKLVASWTDDVTKNCKVELSFSGTVVNSGDIAKKSWTLTLKVTDEAGNSNTATVKLVLDEVFPDLTVMKQEVNVFGGAQLTITDKALLIEGDSVASWSDKYTAECKVVVKFNDKEVKSGDTLDEAGLLTITVTNNQEKSSTAEISITNIAIYGLENIKDLQVDQEVNLLDLITLANGVELINTEIEIDSKRSSIDPSHYTPSYPWKCSIIFTLKWKNWNTAEVKVDNLTINALDYHAVQINNIKPADILPFLKELTRWDKDIYKHIEHLRLAESTRVRDMMWEYGTGKYSPEQYQQLMLRLNTGMLSEIPLWYDNYELIWTWWKSPSDHAYYERCILNELINHTNFKIITNSRRDNLYNLCIWNPNKINIMWLSMGRELKKKLDEEKEKNYDKEKNRLVFCAWWNQGSYNWVFKNKVVQEDYDLPDEHSVYEEFSRTHNKNDHTLDRHLMITVWTNKDGDIDQTNKETGSKFPVWFHDKVLFSGRWFPVRGYSSWNYWWDTGAYASSYPNYLNVAMADLCFQIKADIQDVDELLEMIRSTALTDYIRLDGQTQPLQLINPAWVFKKYLMPQDLPTSVSMSDNTALDKGFYIGLAFDIPGAEVNINGEWMAFSNANQALIKAQNPFTLEWRLNGDLLRKMGYKQGDTVSGTVIAVDDQWNGLSLSTEFTISVKE